MQIGDLVWVDFKDFEDDEGIGVNGVAIVVQPEGHGFYKVLHHNEQRIIHTDFLEKMNEA